MISRSLRLLAIAQNRTRRVHMLGLRDKMRKLRQHLRLLRMQSRTDQSTAKAATNKRIIVPNRAAPHPSNYANGLLRLQKVGLRDCQEGQPRLRAVELESYRFSAVVAVHWPSSLLILWTSKVGSPESFLTFLPSSSTCSPGLSV
jgi:hypothetical protein